MFAGRLQRVLQHVAADAAQQALVHCLHETLDVKPHDEHLAVVLEQPAGTVAVTDRKSIFDEFSGNHAGHFPRRASGL